MKLLIVESPSKANTIGKYLGKDFKVISSYGHIRGLPSEKGAVDPENNFALRYEVTAQSKKHAKNIADSMKNADALYLATDPDREGEAIAWHIVEMLKEKNKLKANLPLKRVVFHEITKNAIIDAVKSPRDIDDNLVKAQQSRQALDYLYGFTISPVLWRKLPGSRSAGRVQSVALRIICSREKEIELFKPQEYWSIIANFTAQQGLIEASLIAYKGEKLAKLSIGNETLAKEIVKVAKSANYKITKVEKKQQKRNPLPPFTTSTLLQEASRKLGFSAKRTALLAQHLYEGIDVGKGERTGLITYMRTDSVSISKEALGATRNHIEKNYGSKYLPKDARYYKTKTKNAQEAHEAIRPTNVGLTPADARPYLDNDHFKLYDLIWKRLVASQMESAVLDIYSVVIDDEKGQVSFKGTANSIAFDGYYKVYRENIDDEDENKKESQNQNQLFAKLSEGEKANLKDINPLQHFTQPPPRYTEASLVKKMEELGIGRPSTYPGIISILQTREYVKIDSKRFFPEMRGRVVCSFLEHYFPKYVEYDFTAKMEDDLDEISHGNSDWKKALSHFWSPLKDKADEVVTFKNSDVIEEIEKDLEYFLFSNEEDNIEHDCPECKGGKVKLKGSKYGFFLGCSNYPDCKYTKKLNPDGTQVDNSQDDRFPMVLGEDNIEGGEISLRKGPYGFYLQRTKGEDIKRCSVPQKKDVETVNLEYAMFMLHLPKSLGVHPESKKEILLNRGRYGFYLMYDEESISLRGVNVEELSLAQSVEIIAKKSKKAKKKDADN